MRRLDEKVRTLEKQLEEKVSLLFSLSLSLFRGMPLLMQIESLQMESLLVSLPLDRTPLFPALSRAFPPTRASSSALCKIR